MKRTTYGGAEPAHVLEIAQELEQKRIMARGGKHPWIDTAKPFVGSVDYEKPSEAFQTWLRFERSISYRAINSQTGEIMLIRNPAAWEWRIEDGQPIFTRPKEISTGEIAPRSRGSKGGQTFEKPVD